MSRSGILIIIFVKRDIKHILYHDIPLCELIFIFLIKKCQRGNAYINMKNIQVHISLK